MLYLLVVVSVQLEQPHHLHGLLLFLELGTLVVQVDQVLEYAGVPETVVVGFSRVVAQLLLGKVVEGLDVVGIVEELAEHSHLSVTAQRAATLDDAPEHVILVPSWNVKVFGGDSERF